MTVSTSSLPSGEGVAALRAPLVCGALGAYDRARVEAMAASLGADPTAAHEDEGSILMLDREPLRWEGPKERGLGWVEGGFWRHGARSWQEAARGGATGLAFAGRRCFLHSSVSGLSPLYWLQDGRAVYFASRIDPVATSSPAPLSVDWDAWASIITLRYPVAERTPFAEIRRLGPFSTLRRRLGRARVDSPSWPWAQVDADADLETAADALTAGFEAGLAPIEEPVLCPLSGGRDSRILLCAAAKAGVAQRALTVSDDEGDTFEEDLAAPVAAMLGIPHERVEASPNEYPDEWAQRASDVDYQFVDHAWLVPLARRLAGVQAPVADGFVIDTLLQGGTHFYTPEACDFRRPRQAAAALFESLQRWGRAVDAVAEPLRSALLERARRGFLARVRPFHGHPWQATLSLYATRSLRGVSNYPHGLLGSRARILTPGASDAVATAALSAAPGEKDGDSLYPAVLERLAPGAGRLPSSFDTPRRPPRLPSRWCAAPAVEAHRRRLADGPLAAHLSPALSAWLEAPNGPLSPDLRLGMEAISLFHAWWQRYRDRLRDADADGLIG